MTTEKQSATSSPVRQFSGVRSIIRILSPGSIVQGYIILAPTPLSMMLALKHRIAAKTALEGVELAHALGNPMDAVIWAKELNTVHEKKMSNISFDCIAIVLSGVIISLLLHQGFFARGLVGEAKSVALPKELPPAVGFNIDLTVFKSYLRVFDQMTEASKSNTNFATVDFFRLSVGRNQFIIFRSWPIWLNRFWLGKLLLVACIVLDLLIYPGATAMAGGILLGLILTSEFVIKNRGYFETEMRKFLTGEGRENQNSIVARDDAGIPDRVAKLHSLLKDGALTQEEYDQEKKKILKRAA